MKEPLSSIERRFLKHFWVSGDYAIWSDGRVSVTGDCQVKAGGMTMEKLPVRFREVGGIFKADGAGLTSLEGFPERIGGDCICPNNPLVSLGVTQIFVGGDLYLQGHQIGDAFWKEFEHAASVDGSIFCSVPNLAEIDRIGEVRSKNNQGKFFAEYRADIPILRQCNGNIELFNAPSDIVQTMKNYQNTCWDGMIPAAARLFRMGFRKNAGI